MPEISAKAMSMCYAGNARAESLSMSSACRDRLERQIRLDSNYLVTPLSQRNAENSNLISSCTDTKILFVYTWIKWQK